MLPREDKCQMVWISFEGGSKGKSQISTFTHPGPIWYSSPQGPTREFPGQINANKRGDPPC